MSTITEQVEAVAKKLEAVKHSAKHAYNDRTGLGQSIFARPGKSTNRGYHVVNGAQTAVRALQRADDRARDRPAGDR